MDRNDNWDLHWGDLCYSAEIDSPSTLRPPHSTSVFTGVLFFREDVGEVGPSGHAAGSIETVLDLTDDVISNKTLAASGRL
jgi:hypothetical protein